MYVYTYIDSSSIVDLLFDRVDMVTAVSVLHAIHSYLFLNDKIQTYIKS